MNLKNFYENHHNFSGRSSSEYYLSPGIKCKYDILLENLGKKKKFTNGIDLGCSGNSFLLFYENVKLKSFFDIAFKPLIQYHLKINNYKNKNRYHNFWNILCGDLTNLPYRDNSFDFVCSLDTLEHIKNDNIAISEISRILRKKGIALITVPHRAKFHTNQDILIGHFRRYEINQILELFKKYNLDCLNYFGIYGQFMKIVLIQKINPQKVEERLIKLRLKYNQNLIFRKFWNLFVIVCSKLMKLDAKYQPLKRVMNIAFIFKKQ